MSVSMRIWYQSAAQLSSLTTYQASLQKLAAKVCSADVEVFFNGVTEERYEGRLPAEVLKYTYAKLVLPSETIDFARRAEREGYDAFIVGSFSEPFLPEIRSMVEIPVVSLPEASMLVACSMAEQFALVTLAPANARRLKAVVRRHGLDSRVMGVYALPHDVDEGILDAALKQPDAVIEDFKTVARTAIESGADVVVPAEGILNLIVHENGLGTMDGATIQDPIAAAFLYAEMLVNLKRRTGQGVGRRWTYAMPSPELKAQLDRHRH